VKFFVRAKYAAKPQTIDGLRFASKLEATRYQQLKLLEKTGHIRDLRTQIRFRLLDPFIHPKTGKTVPEVAYVADFVYYEPPLYYKGVPWEFDQPADGWRRVIEDCKGIETPVFRLKEKMFMARYGTTIRIVRREDVRSSSTRGGRAFRGRFGSRGSRR
jgi:hypothetical protein